MDDTQDRYYCDPRGWWAQWKEPRTLLTIVAILAAILSWYFGVSGHCADEDIHQGTKQLDARYVREEMHQRDMEELKESVFRVERKLDKVADRMGIVP